MCTGSLQVMTVSMYRQFAGHASMYRQFAGHASVYRQFAGHASVYRQFAGHASEYVQAVCTNWCSLKVTSACMRLDL